MVERQCHQKQNFQSLLSRNDFYGDRTFYHITADLEEKLRIVIVDRGS